MVLRRRHIIPAWALTVAVLVLVGIGAGAPGPAFTPLTSPSPGIVGPSANPVLGLLRNDGGSDSPAGSSQPEQPALADTTTPAARPVATKHIAAASTQAKFPPVKPKDFVTIDGRTYPARTYKTLAMPNDPSANQQWVTDANLSAAWDIPAGSADTLLAIIDTGFGLGHQDLAGRWYASPGESGATASEQPSALNCTDRGVAMDASCNLVDDNLDGITDNEIGSVTYQNPSQLNCTDQGKPLNKSCNRIDDDNNGFIDDVTGWDFADGDSSVQAGQLDPVGSGTTHGTRVAGIAAATGNNGVGIAGVDWHTKILPIQALDDDGYGNTFSVGEGIIYAADQDADVISVSLGSDLPDEYVLSAVRYAMAKGSVVVAAAGNDGCACMVYPAAYAETLSVGALGIDGLPASYSSYGPALDVLAPGTDLKSTDWKSTNQTTAYATGISGTSYATPLVGGLLTRLLSQQPAAESRQLSAALTETVSRMSLSGTTVRNDRLGFGKVDAGAASRRMSTPLSVTQLYQFAPASHGEYLHSSTPYEPTGDYRVIACTNDRPGTTLLYNLSKAGQSFYSVSSVEALSAQDEGYTMTIAGQTCLSQPHDAPVAVRRIDLFQEFKNYLAGK